MGLIAEDCNQYKGVLYESKGVPSLLHAKSIGFLFLILIPL